MVDRVGSGCGKRTYTYDAAGNIVQIEDTAQDTLFFDNAMVTPTTLYKYDALHRLVSAQGRERADMAQTGPADPARGVIPDPNGTVSYVQTYVYDGVGNILEMKHQGGTEANPGGGGWTRGYTYATGSNRLESTTPISGATPDVYVHSVRGAMTSMPHLPWGMARDWRDQLRNVMLNTGGDDAVYHYDAGGQRVRKVVRKGAVTEERVYLGAWERYTHSGSGLVRETLHAMDGQRRIAMVETEDPAGTPVVRFRFQLDNHLGSVALEVDQAGALISHEEYHPYGTTSWWALASSAQVSAKRYRYTGMERDDETRLGNHGVRQLAVWLARWCTCDPIPLANGSNRYEYGGASPTARVDRTGQTWMLWTIFESVAEAPAKDPNVAAVDARFAAAREVAQKQYEISKYVAKAEARGPQTWMSADGSTETSVGPPPTATGGEAFDAAVWLALPGSIPSMLAPGPEEFAVGEVLSIVTRGPRLATAEAPWLSDPAAIPMRPANNNLWFLPEAEPYQMAAGAELDFVASGSRGSRSGVPGAPQPGHAAPAPRPGLIPGDADYVGPIAPTWSLSPEGAGAHLVPRADVAVRPGLAQFDQPGTPRFYPSGSPTNAGAAHVRIHRATVAAGLARTGGNQGMTVETLVQSYRTAYSSDSLSGIRGSVRTPDSSVVLAEDVTPAEAFELILAWGGL